MGIRSFVGSGRGGKGLLSLFVAVAAFLSGNSHGADIPKSIRAAVDSAIDRMRPALVRIHVVSTDYLDGRELKFQGVGSGAIITEDGFLVTNHHVAGHGVRMVCTLWNRDEVDADLVGTDALTDISVLKLRPAKPRKFACAKFGDSSKMRVGDWVLAMGSPMALSQSVTLGILSNLEMMMPRQFAARFRLDGEDVGGLVKWFGHDAAIYGGNSGGPLVNLKGEIIGINEISYGLSGAIPGNLAKAVAEELMARGRVTRSWLGVDLQALFKHEDSARGVMIGGVLPDSPASRAGIMAGDLLIRLDGKDVNVRYEEQMPDFMRLITSLPLNRDVTAVLVRAGKEMTVQMRPVERGEVNLPEKELKQWGLTVRNLSILNAREMKRSSQDGALVTSVRPGGPSGEAKPPLGGRDIILRVNDTEINSVKDLEAVTRRLTDGKKEPVPVLVAYERRASRFLTVIKVGIQELRDPGLEVAKAWLPVDTHVISREIAEQVGSPGLRGYYLTRVYSGTSADKAGLEVGDFLTAVDGEKLNASGPEHEADLAAMIRQYDIGATVELSVLRGKDEKKIKVELERSPKLRREMKKYRNDDFEFTVRDIAFFDVAEEQWKREQRGALVEEVRPGSWAELGSLGVDDLIVEVDGQPIEDADALKAAMEQVTRAKKTFVVMKVVRGIHTAFLELEPTWK